ncbi:MAG: hypothetical protein CR987_01070 [Draconibacterium sp.]|nr:MAG: hypothetical protein CR987_01070 [Draconibacterium sp.]
MEENKQKKTGIDFSFFIRKTRSFLGVCTSHLNREFQPGVEFVKIEGPISGYLYMKQPADKNVKFVVYKEELKNIKEEVLKELPDEMFFV